VRLLLRGRPFIRTKGRVWFVQNVDWDIVVRPSVGILPDRALHRLALPLWISGISELPPHGRSKSFRPCVLFRLHPVRFLSGEPQAIPLAYAPAAIPDTGDISQGVAGCEARFGFASVSGSRLLLQKKTAPREERRLELLVAASAQ
jgi:hypothetical protein